MVTLKEAKWEQKIAKQRQLRGKGLEMLWARAVLLVDIYKDQEYRIAQGAFSDGDLFRLLDAELHDQPGVSFWQLMTVLKRYPNKEQWAGANLTSILAQVVAEKQAVQIATKIERGEPKKKAELRDPTKSAPDRPTMSFLVDDVPPFKSKLQSKQISWANDKVHLAKLDIASHLFAVCNAAELRQMRGMIDAALKNLK